MIKTFRRAALIAALGLFPAHVVAEAAELRGSPGSMVRQNEVARKAELPFFNTLAEVKKGVAEGGLVRVPGNADYSVIASHPYALPEVKLLIERLSSQYREATGEKLVVTSLTRPKANQPPNAHRLSVHPAGMAIDLRVPASASARAWLESTLLSLEAKGVLDATRERMPPHYHVAVFPAAYATYVERLEANRPTEDVTTSPSLEAEQQGVPAAEEEAPVVTAAMIPVDSPERGTQWLGVLLVTVMFAGAARGARLVGSRVRSQRQP